jgi:16S rRNA (cytidine1402-2'-O)-methyltransferase
LPGTLYLVATPIGNLEDMTFRAVRILRDDVQYIACEDTRTTQKLLNHYSIHKPLISYHEHNEASRTPELLGKLNEGESVALLTDAGTPLISDPGYRLVQTSAEEGIAVVPLPGACAAILALAASGLPTDEFRFVGFLPPKQHARRRLFEQLATEEGTLIAYESPHRIVDSLADMTEIWGARPVVLARELTKLHEELLRGTPAEISAALESRPSIRGEMTLVIGRMPDRATQAGEPIAEIKRLEEAGFSRMDAVKSVARQFGLPKREVYRLAMEMDNSSPDKRRD